MMREYHVRFCERLRGKFPRSTHQMFCEIWQTILKTTHVGMRDDFFNLGGNSILAMQLITQINKNLGYQVTVADIFQYRSIERLLPTLFMKKNLLKTLSQGESKNKIIAIHPAWGGGEFYQELSEILLPQYQLLGMDSAYFYGDMKLTSLLELARHYVSQIPPIILTDSKLCLLGFSLGGQIALEMACQLEQQGLKKMVLYLLDTLLPVANLDDHLKQAGDIGADFWTKKRFF